MAIADEITRVIRDRIAHFDGTSTDTAMVSVGTVIEVADGIARVYGLSGVGYLELVEFPRTGLMGVAFNLEEDSVAVPVLGDYTVLHEDDEVRTTGRIIQVPVGDALLGRTVNALGEPLDGGGPILTDKFRPVERVAPGVITRHPVNTPVQTGLKIVDALIPIGRGQRELIIGDRQTGKTAIALDTIINQKGKDLICIYVAIGQKNFQVAQIARNPEGYGALEYTIIVHASADDPAPLQVHGALRRLRHGRRVHGKRQGRADHLRRSRRSTPMPTADVAVCAARRAVRPIPVTCSTCTAACWSEPHVSRRVRRRVADRPADHRDPGQRRGRLYSHQRHLDHRRPDLPGNRPVQRRHPAGHERRYLGLRVGGAAQTKAMRQVAGTLKLDLAQFRELAAFAQFGSDLDRATKAKIDRGLRQQEIMKQKQYEPMPVEHQIMIIYAASKGYLDEVPLEKVAEWESQFHRYMDANYTELIASIHETSVVNRQKLPQETFDQLDAAIKEYQKTAPR